MKINIINIITIYETLAMAFAIELIIVLIDVNLLKTFANLKILKILKTLRKDKFEEI